MPGIVGSLPNNIANGQVMDAGPVMANFNWLMNQVNANAASLAGANVFAQAIQAPAATTGVQLATAAQVQNGVNNAADSGVVDAYICAPAVPVTGYANGQQFTMTTANTNTLTNPTLAISALAAKTIVNQDGSALVAGQITANTPFTYIYDSTLDKFRINPPMPSTFSLSSSIPQNSKSAAYTTVLADANKHILHPAADNNPRTFTIDANVNVAYSIGTTITFVNQINTLTIAITADTLTLAGVGSTGSRTLNASGMATALKVGTTSWKITGQGIS